jgi:hypothetical protein
MMAVAVAVPRTVTLSHASGNSSAVVRVLGEQIGEEIRVAGSVKQDYFMVRLQDVPAQEAIDKIAETLNATWVRRDGVLTLTRTDEQDREDFEQEQALVIEGFQEALDDNRIKGPYGVAEAAEGLERLIPLSGDQLDSNYLAIRDLRKQSPIWRLLVRVAAELGAEGLAELSLYETVQYAASPGPRQRSLVGSRALKLYEDETKSHMSAIRSTDVLRRLKGQRLDSALVGAYRDGPPDPASITVTMMRGEEWVTISTNLSDRAILNLRLLGPNGEGLPDELTASPQVIEPSDLVANITTNLRALHSRDERYRREPLKYRDYASDPTEHELIGLYTSEWILEDAASKGLNVIGLLSDSLFYNCLLMNFNGATAGELWSSYCSSGSSHEASVEGNWLTIVPRKRASVRANRVDRGLVKQFIDQYEREGMLTIDSVSKIAASSEDGGGRMTAGLIAAYATGEPAFDGLGFGSDIGLLRLYHFMNLADKQKAQRGAAALRYPNADAKVNEELNKFIFAGYRGIRSEPIKDHWTVGPTGFGYAESGSTDEQLRDGIPRNSMVTVEVSGRDLIYRKAGLQVIVSGQSAQVVGRRIADAEVRPNEMLGDHRLFYIAPSERLFVQVELPGIGYVSGAVQLDGKRGDRKYVTLEGLPADVRDEIVAARDEARKGFEGRTGRAKRVPPPD